MPFDYYKKSEISVLASPLSLHYLKNITWESATGIHSDNFHIRGLCWLPHLLSVYFYNTHSIIFLLTTPLTALPIPRSSSYPSFSSAILSKPSSSAV